MKKILLLIIFIAGLISFPSKVNKPKQNKNRISTTNSNNKSVKITGPRYRVDGSLGVFSKTNSRSLKTTTLSIAILPEWKADINKKFDITFGPKVTTSLSFLDSVLNGTELTSITPSLILGMEVDFNYKVKEKVKIYSGLEVGTGIGYLIYLKDYNNSYKLRFDVAVIGKLSGGIKIRDRYNVGLYVGNYATNPKGLFGIELGYTF
ncbi:hypothetical protein [Streptobacillus ratti]|uniref:hypothetical protein n=1 Tax=Streptobacillus ratti TaxID=1720557 RepID=UPI000AF52235|nr:hypothetical protein [Streptobacillus ratti]